MSNKTLYLHVGMDKTGTSAVQYFMHKNKDRLIREAGLCYPLTGLWQDYSHHPFAFSALGLHGYSKDNLNELFFNLKTEACDAENVLISSECLFKTPLGSNFGMLHNLIIDAFDEFKLIVYVRRQDEWVESRHKHSIISGKELSLEMLVKPHFCDYKAIIDRWAKVFGKENIIVKPYEKKQFIGGSIFSDFISIFNLTLSRDYEIPEKGLNVSLGHDASDFKNLCNKIGFLSAGVDTLNEGLIDYQNQLSSLSTSQYLLSPLERLNLIERYSDINSGIAKEYLNRESGVLFYEESPNPNQDWEKYSGIIEATIIDIGDYLSKRNNDLLMMMKPMVKKAKKSNDVDTAKAGVLLNKLYKRSLVDWFFSK